MCQNKLNFEGERAPKKRDFWSKFSKKYIKTPLLACFSKTLTAAQNIGQYRVFIVTWESSDSENQFGRPKKRSIISEKFLDREILRSAPAKHS